MAKSKHQKQALIKNKIHLNLSWYQHLYCPSEVFDSIRYHVNQYKTLTKNFTEIGHTYIHVHTYIHTDTVKAICPHGDYCPRGHNECYIQ